MGYNSIIFLNLFNIRPQLLPKQLQVISLILSNLNIDNMKGIKNSVRNIFFLITLSLSCLHTGIAQTNPQITKGQNLLFSNPDSSLYYFYQAKDSSILINDSSNYIKSLTFIALAHQVKGDYESASHLSFQALEKAREYNATKEVGTILNNLGALYFELKEWQNSEKYYHEALTIMTDLKDTSWLARIYGNIAGIAYMRKDYQESIEYLNLSLEMATSLQQAESIGGAISNMAMVYSTIGENDKAIESYWQGYHILNKLGEKRGVCITLTELSRLYLKTSDYDKAEQTYNKVLKIAQESKHVESIANSYEGLAELYAIKNDFKQAYNYQQLHTKWKDSLLNKQRISLITDLNTKYQTEKKEQENKILLAENQIINTQMQKSKKEKFLLWLIMMSSLLVLILVINQLRIRRKTNKQLRAQFEITQKTLKERETLIQEVHHRVKNNMQIISSMLNIQAKSISDQATKQAILESRAKVLSMAMVHQNLYMSDDISKINISAYLTKLLDELEFTFSSDEHEIEIIKDIEPLNFDVETSIPLGLIITELFSNIYKHAFNGQQRGEIIISLKKNDQLFHLKVEDNGCGFNQKDIKSQSFGIQLIKSLTKKLRGEISWTSDHGTLVDLKFIIHN